MIKQQSYTGHTCYVCLVSTTANLTAGNTILCPVDFSGNSKKILHWAIVMAQQLRAHVTVLYAYRLTAVTNVEALQLKRKMEEDAQQRFVQLERELFSHVAVSYDFKTEIGFVNDRIEDHTRKNNLSMLVIDKHISHNKENFDNLLSRIHVPVILIP